MEKNELASALKKVQAIIDWFENQEEIDIEKALEKVKEGAALLKSSRAQLKDLENEFEVVKKELGEE